jgi:uncharacterized protein
MAKFLMAPKDTKFYDLFEQQSTNLVAGAEKLVNLFEDYRDVELKAQQLKELEMRGDSITHEIMQKLHASFVTPIDREDIALLAHTLDDIMDYIEAAGRTAYLYQVEQPMDKSRDLALVITKITYKLREILPYLRHREQFKKILEECVEINRLENEADDIHHAATAELFHNCYDACFIIKWREIYQHLESATDRGEDVADILEGVVLKNV